MNSQVGVFLWQIVGWAVGGGIGILGFYADGWPWWIPMLCAAAGMAVPIVVAAGADPQGGGVNDDTIIVTLADGPFDGHDWEIPAAGVVELHFGGQEECRYRLTDDPKVWRYVEPGSA